MAIIFHVFDNLIVAISLIFHQFISGFDHSIPMTVADYKQHFLDDLEWMILFVSLSLPYLIYFIYKNFPRNYDINKLTYFAHDQ